MSIRDEVSGFTKVLNEAKDVFAFLDRIKESYPKFVEMSKNYDRLKEENDRLKEETANLKEENANLKEENDRMKADLEHISKELEKVSKEFQDLSKKTAREVGLREILALSMTLLIEVFGAAPHSKLLFLLHGQKVDWTRQDLTKASGISAAAVRKSLADLNSARLVEYDVETGTVKLLKRIY